VQTGGLSAQDALRLALAGGDDYELAFAVPPARRAALEPWLARGEVTLIGELIEKQSGEVAEGAEGGNVLLRRGTEPLSAADLRSLDARGFDHFAP
jgi:thiamine monophosphate kinase